MITPTRWAEPSAVQAVEVQATNMETTNMETIQAELAEQPGLATKRPFSSWLLDSPTFPMLLFLWFLLVFLRATIESVILVGNGLWALVGWANRTYIQWQNAVPLGDIAATA